MIEQPHIVEAAEQGAVGQLTHLSGVIDRGETFAAALDKPGQKHFKNRT